MSAGILKMIKGQVASAAFLLLMTGCAADSVSDATMSPTQAQKLIETQQQLSSIPKTTWRQLLPNDRFEVLWEGATERPFTGALLSEKRQGVYVTAGCKLPVFHAQHKYESGSGWPSFWEIFNADNVVLKKDYSWGMRRVEVLSRCGEHLGHVFEDGPLPTGLRYCINSAALEFVPDLSALEP